MYSFTSNCAFPAVHQVRLILLNTFKRGIFKPLENFWIPWVLNRERGAVTEISMLAPEFSLLLVLESQLLTPVSAAALLVFYSF